VTAISRTAGATTLWRARESARPSGSRLFEDPLAAAFLDWRLRWAVCLSRLPLVGAALPWSLIDGHVAGSRGTVVVRTRYIDDVLRDALRQGARQVVILGAGFDSRAYRIAGIDRVRVFEVDLPQTQASKHRLVLSRLGALPPHVTLIPADLTAPGLDAVMREAGFRAEAVTFFICEGVTHYLSAPAVDALFRHVARAAAGSRMVFTYIHRAILEGTPTFAGADTTLATVRRSGEPYTFGFDPSELGQYVAERGLTLIEDVGAEEYRARYLAPIGRGHEPLSEFQRAALVEVSAAIE
jgi:methyltransferase (TIGR00027 family)